MLHEIVIRSVIARPLIGALIAAPCALAAEHFTSDKPMPLRWLDPGTDDGDRATRETALPSEQGAATVTIRDYRTAVECDHRWYLADRKDNVVGARKAHPSC